MIELIQVHDLGATMEDGRTTINIPITANILTKNTVRLRRNFAGAKTRRRDIMAKMEGRERNVMVNAISTPWVRLRNNEITLGEYKELIECKELTEPVIGAYGEGGNPIYFNDTSMKTNYNNRMMTEYEKESTEKPKFPENTLIRESSFPGEKPSLFRRFLAWLKK